MISREVLLAAWEAWDAKPYDKHTAVAMEDACHEAADDRGISTTELRVTLTQWHFDGLSRSAAVDRLWDDVPVLLQEL